MLKKLLTGVAGVVVGNIVEWGFHKHVLHGLGKNKKSIWNFHWYQHHKRCRKTMLDTDYEMTWRNLIKTPEFITLSAASCLLGLAAPKAPLFIAGLVGYGTAYYGIHMKAHLDNAWAKKWIPWHVNHHQFGNQEHSFNVVFPLTDYIMGTTSRKVSY
jgi:hypothetical protein